MADYDKLIKVYLKRRNDKSFFNYNRLIEVPNMIQLIGNVKNKQILDLGCGFGDHARILSKKGLKKLVGLDLSKKMIEKAQEQNLHNCKFYVYDLNRKLKFNNSSFDLVFSSLTIHYLKNLNTFFKEVNRVLKKDGVFIFSTGNPIFNLINQTKDFLIGVRTINGKKVIGANYFNNSEVKQNLGNLGLVKMFNYGPEDFIKNALNNGFELIDYHDAKPVKEAKKVNPDKYKLTTTLPTFTFYKFKKK